MRRIVSPVFAAVLPRLRTRDRDRQQLNPLPTSGRTGSTGPASMTCRWQALEYGVDTHIAPERVLRATLRATFAAGPVRPAYRSREAGEESMDTRNQNPRAPEAGGS